MRGCLVLVMDLMLFAPAVQAEQFANAFLSFALPRGWTCDQEGGEFVCSPPHPAGDKSPAIMIFAGKLAGPDDTLNAYRARLSLDPPATGRGTIVRPPTLNTILGTIWVDATLFGSELADFYTRYLATTKDGIAVLYTFSAHRSQFEELQGAAIQAVETLSLKNPVGSR
jgi:hypothetical protein